MSNENILAAVGLSCSFTWFRARGVVLPPCKAPSPQPREVLGSTVFFRPHVPWQIVLPWVSAGRAALGRRIWNDLIM